VHGDPVAGRVYRIDDVAEHLEWGRRVERFPVAVRLAPAVVRERLGDGRRRERVRVDRRVQLLQTGQAGPGEPPACGDQPRQIRVGAQLLRYG
jgi:hypothetical protein